MGVKRDVSKAEEADKWREKADKETCKGVTAGAVQQYTN